MSWSACAAGSPRATAASRPGRACAWRLAIAGGGPRTLLRSLRWVGAWGKRDPEERHEHLGPVAVDRHLQGLGIGSAMLAAHAEDLDVRRLTGGWKPTRTTTCASTALRLRGRRAERGARRAELVHAAPAVSLNSREIQGRITDKTHACTMEGGPSALLASAPSREHWSTQSRAGSCCPAPAPRRRHSPADRSRGADVLLRDGELGQPAGARHRRVDQDELRAAREGGRSRTQLSDLSRGPAVRERRCGGRAARRVAAAGEGPCRPARGRAAGGRAACGAPGAGGPARTGGMGEPEPRGA